MGKGTIVSGGSGGQYQVQLKYNRAQSDAEIVAQNNKITVYQTVLLTETDPLIIARINMAITSAQKRISFLNDNIPDDPTVSAWCADLTENLLGDVGTIEVPGEQQTVMIQPGNAGNAAYDVTRDGVLTPLLSQSAFQAYYNLGLTPGWQKWQPLYRFGTITGIDYGTDTADVTYEAANSSQQNLGINQSTTAADVPIDYITCDSEVFNIGDSVLIEFTDQDWAQPVIIGFKDNPVTCIGCFSPDNLVPKSCMEVGSGWVQRTDIGDPPVSYDPAEKGTAISYSAEQAQQGAQSLKMTMPIWDSATEVSGSFSSEIFTTVNGGPFYKLTAHVYVTSFETLGNDGDISITLYRGNGDNLPDYRVRLLEADIVFNTWVELTVTAQTFQGGPDAVVDLGIFGSDWQSMPIVYFDNVSLIPT